MDIVIDRILDCKLIAKKNGRFLTDFLICFTYITLVGRATLRVLHSSHSVDTKAVAKQFQGKTLSVEVSVEDVHDFESLGISGNDEIESTDDFGGYELQGRVVQHLISGDGSIFQVFDITLLLDVNSLPPDSLEVYEGTWAKFRAKKLVFSPIGQ